MILKGTFKNSPVLAQLLMFVSVLSIGLISMYVMSFVYLASRFGMSQETIQNLLLHLTDYPDVMRNMQFFQTVTLFLFPAIACAWLFSDNYKRYLQIDTPVRLPVAGLAIVGMMVAFPFINGVYALNQQIVFPEALKSIENWMKTMEEANKTALAKMLYVRSVWDLSYNIVLICVLAAIGEELLFRGLLQNIFARLIKNPHIVIWTVAVLFSALHFQFYGFIPRMLLGAYLGYLLYYTQNIWIPILAHFTNNFFGVITATIYQDQPEAASRIDALDYGATTWWLAASSLVLFLFVFWEIRKRSEL